MALFRSRRCVALVLRRVERQGAGNSQHAGDRRVVAEETGQAKVVLLAGGRVDDPEQQADDLLAEPGLRRVGVGSEVEVSLDLEGPRAANGAGP